VAVEGGAVKYYKNGTLLYTSTVTPQYPLLVDTSLNTAGTSVTNVVISGSGGSGGVDIEWLVTDQLGTPRMIFDKTGSLAGTKRHDYLPFGEELYAGIGIRSVQLGYNVNDGIRQKFSQEEHDEETRLDFFFSRYFSSGQGRFTSADSILGRRGNPQSLNSYAYVVNNPLRFIDPLGFQGEEPDNRKRGKKGLVDDDDIVYIDHEEPCKCTNPPSKKGVRPSPGPVLWNLPSPFSIPSYLCTTGNCGKRRTIGDDVRVIRDAARVGQSLGETVLENTDSVDSSGSLFWVINGGVHLTADGDVFVDFTPPQSGLIDLFRAGASGAILHPVPFSFSVTTTHIFGPNTPDTRRSFFGGGSISVSGAIPIGRAPVGPYIGGSYSPSSRLFAVSGGVGSAPQVNGGYSLSPTKPLFSLPRFAWKRPH
jgi:RHS repeat-associated protein